MKGRPFLLTPYNRKGDSYRSPWSNKYQPAPPAAGQGKSEPYFPSDRLRALEKEANELWQVYGEMYYGGEAVGSVYVWEQEGSGGAAAGGDGGFAGCFAVRKSKLKIFNVV